MAVVVVGEPEAIEIACGYCKRRLLFTADDVKFSEGETVSECDFGITCPKCKEWTVIRDFGKRGGRAAEIVTSMLDRSRPARIRALVAECGAEQMLDAMAAYYREGNGARRTRIAMVLERARDEIKKEG